MTAAAVCLFYHSSTALPSSSRLGPLFYHSSTALRPLLYRSSTTRGVYHLAGLLPHPSSSQPPSTSAASTICGVYCNPRGSTICGVYWRIPATASGHPHPRGRRPPAESTATRGVYLLRGQAYGIIPYDYTWPLVYPPLRTLSDVYVSTLPFMNRVSYYHCTDWTPGSLPGRDNPNVDPPPSWWPFPGRENPQAGKV